MKNLKILQQIAPGRVYYLCSKWALNLKGSLLKYFQILIDITAKQ